MKNFYLILDSAIMEEKIEYLKDQYDNLSLYRGEKAEQLESIAPYLFKNDANNDLLKWFTGQEERCKWGIIIYSQENFKTIHKHLRKFLIIKTEQGKRLYFRYYDPRVLSDFLKTCDINQLKEFFGPIDKFFTFMEEDELLEISFERNKLEIKNQEATPSLDLMNP